MLDTVGKLGEMHFQSERLKKKKQKNFFPQPVIEPRASPGCN